MNIFFLYIIVCIFYHLVSLFFTIFLHKLKVIQKYIFCMPLKFSFKYMKIFTVKIKFVILETKLKCHLKYIYMQFVEFLECPYAWCIPQYMRLAHIIYCTISDIITIKNCCVWINKSTSRVWFSLSLYFKQVLIVLWMSPQWNHIGFCLMLSHLVHLWAGLPIRQFFMESLCG